jgi:DNA-binding GntR family transcriptional regulator
MDGALPAARGLIVINGALLPLPGVAGRLFPPLARLMSRLPGLPDKELVGNYLIASLARKYGTHLARATEKLSLAEASPEIAKLLMVEPRARLLKLDRVVFSIRDEPIEWRVALCELKDEHYLAESR